MRTVLTPRAVDFPQWYQDLITMAQLAENGPVRGTMVIRPTAYAVWERIQAGMDRRIKDAEVQNVYFPLLLPESYLHREAEHVEGFSPELAVVTTAGGSELEEPVVVRPTSETVFGAYMSKWVQSYRDLPLLLNQWCNVVRWEMRTRIFLRTSEFLWQEGHTVHSNEAEARAYALRILHEVYEDFMAKELCIPTVVGLKTKRERFAGATHTYCIEGCMGDGKALQLGTTHELGQNFARAFAIRFTDVTGKQRDAWTTSWGTSTRMVGGLIMVHGDDYGLRIPPNLAPTQVLVQLVKADAAAEKVTDELVAQLKDAGLRVRLDARTHVPFGRRAVDAELQGIPVRIELGPRDIAAGQAIIARRIPRTKDEVPLTEAAASVSRAITEDQQQLFEEATDRLTKAVCEVTSLDEAQQAAESGWAKMPWDAVGEDGEVTLNSKGITVRCLVRADGSVPESQDEPNLIAYIARAY